MGPFRDAPIRQKLTLVIALTSTSALLLVTAAAAAYEITRFRRDTVLDLEGQAQIITAVSLSALASGDRAVVQKVLLALSTQHEIVYGRVVRPDGQLFAEYMRPDAAALHSPLSPQRAGPHFEHGLVCLNYPMAHDGQRLGTLTLSADLRELHSRFKSGASILAVAALASLLVALIVGGRLQRIISEPILNLTQLAQNVAARQDYSARGIKQGNDEIGALVDRFNDMLTQIERREKQVLEITDREEARIGQDLHDGLCQLLVSIGFNAELLKRDLAVRALPEAANAERIARKLTDAIRMARHLAHGLHPVNLLTEGLGPALQALAADTSQDFGVACTAECAESVRVGDLDVGRQLYRIAREAVHNAVKHGRPRRITIRLVADRVRGHLAVANDGQGFARPLQPGGIGLDLMRYRAGVIGGRLEIRPAEAGGTVVTCSFHPGGAKGLSG
jgi:signal transduction histidine kinase